MTKEQIIIGIKTDAKFALSFAIANNLSGIMEALSSYGLVPSISVIDQSLWAYNTLLEMLRVNKTKAIELITSVPYNPNPKNAWTSGFDTYFKGVQSSNNTSGASGKFSLDALLGGLGAGLSTYASVSTEQNGTTSTVSEEKAAAAAAEAEKAAAKKKQNMIIGFSIGGVILIIVLYAIFKKKKPETTN